MDYRRHIRRVLLAGVVTAAFYLRNLLLLPILTRCLGPESYGVWSKLHALLNFFMPLVGLGLVQALQRQLPNADAERRPRLLGEMLAGLATGGGILIVLLYANSPWLAPYLDCSGGGKVTGALLPALGGAILANALWQGLADYQQYALRPRAYAAVVLALVAALPAAALLGWRFGPTGSLWIPVTAWLGAHLLVAGGALAATIRRDGLGFDVKLGREMAAYGAPLLPLAALLWLVHCSDRFMLPWLRPDLGDAGVGVYAANYSLASLAALVFAPFLTFYTPQATQLAESGHSAEAGHLTARTLKFAWLGVGFLTLTAPGLAGWALTGLAGPDYVAAPEVVLLVMLGYGGFMTAQALQLPLLLAGRTGRVAGHGAAAAGVNLLLNYLLIPLPGRWGGLNGAALATALAFAALCLLHWRAWPRESAWPIGGQQLAGLLGLAALANVPAWLAAGCGRPLAGFAAGALAYAGLLLVTRLVTRHELRGFLAAVGMSSTPPPAA